MKYSLDAPSLPSPVPCQPAPGWIRGAAFIYDSLPAGVLFMLLCAIALPPLSVPTLEQGVGYTDPFASLSPTDLSDSLRGYLSVLLRLGAVCWIGYVLWNIIFEALWGTTPGKWLVGLRVASTPNPQSCPAQEGLTWAASALRFLAAGLSWATFNIGHAMSRWRKDKAMLHDLLSQTKVVIDPTVELPILGQSRKEIQKLCAIGAWALVVLGFAYSLVIFIQTMRQLATLA